MEVKPLSVYPGRMVGSSRPAPMSLPGGECWQMTGASNQKIADKLRELADLLEQQGANPFRVR